MIVSNKIHFIFITECDYFNEIYLELPMCLVQPLVAIINIELEILHSSMTGLKAIIVAFHDKENVKYP